MVGQQAKHVEVILESPLTIHLYIVCSRRRTFMFAICPLHCAHSPSLADEVTESTTLCEDRNYSPRYNSVHPSTLNYLLTSHGLTRAVLVVSNTSKDRTCLSAFAVNTITLITKPLPLRFQPNYGKNYHTPDLLYVENASNWILTP